MDGDSAGNDASSESDTRWWGTDGRSAVHYCDQSMNIGWHAVTDESLTQSWLGLELELRTVHRVTWAAFGSKNLGWYGIAADRLITGAWMDRSDDIWISDACAVQTKQSKAMISRDINNVLVCVLSGCIWDWSDRSAVSYHGSVPVDRMRENHRSMVWYFLLWLHANELLDSLSGAVCFACNKSNKYAHAYTF